MTAPLGALGTRFRPDGAVTGIGSLPFTDPADAVAFVAEQAREVPFWPQLPHRGIAGGMLTQSLWLASPILSPRPEPAIGFEVDTADLDELKRLFAEAPVGLHEEQAAGFFEFERALRAGRFAAARAVKGQLTGPMTLAWFVSSGGEAVISRPSVVDALARWTIRQATWQIQMLRAFGLPVVIFVDEPALGVVSQLGGAAWAAGVLREVCDGIRLAGAIAGVHCCAAIDFGVLRGARPDVMSFDLSLHEVATDVAVTEFWARQGTVALGLVPTVAADVMPTAAELFDAWQAACAGTEPRSVLAERTMVTATCGLGLVDVAQAEAAFSRANEVSALIRGVVTQRSS